MAFAAAARMRDLGFDPLDISPNYYDDLEAPLDLAPELTSRLRTAHILYDCDEASEYFQFYSRSYGAGFFFEIVERRGGYRGCGAANAPFRIAAQRRSLPPKGMPRV